MHKKHAKEQIWGGLDIIDTDSLIIVQWREESMVVNVSDTK